jgi:hypothetical protein
LEGDGTRHQRSHHGRAESRQRQAFHRETRREVLFFCLVAGGLLLVLGLASLIVGWTVAGQGGWLWLLFILPYATILVGVEVGARVRDPMRFQRLLRLLIVPIVLAKLVELVLLIVTPLTGAVPPSPAD